MSASTLSQARPAILDGEKTVTMTAPAWPVSGKQEQAWMAEVVASGQWSWLGEHERAFCRDYAAFIGSQYCMCLANGTVTLQCALQAVGVEAGHEVIVPGLTWVATAQAALDIGANVVLVDIDPETLCISPEAIRAAITPKTKAIIPVHLYGCMCDMDAILEIAREHDLKIVEDVAHQHGSQWRGRGAGAIGDAGSFSFQQSKVLTCGEGGAVTCNSQDVADTIHALKHVGFMPDRTQAWEADAKPPLTPAGRYAHNYRFTEMQAVLLRGGLSRLPEQTRIREENVAYLTERINALGGPLRAVERDPRVTRQAYYGMNFIFDPSQARGLHRDQYRQALSAEGCSFGTPYPPVYRHPLLNLYDRTSPVPYRDPAVMQNYAALHLPEVEKAFTETGVIVSQQHLLGSRAYLNEWIEAMEKVNGNLDEIREHFEAEAREAEGQA